MTQNPIICAVRLPDPISKSIRFRQENPFAVSGMNGGKVPTVSHSREHEHMASCGKIARELERLILGNFCPSTQIYAKGRFGREQTFTVVHWNGVSWSIAAGDNQHIAGYSCRSAP